LRTILTPANLSTAVYAKKDNGSSTMIGKTFVGTVKILDIYQ